MMRQPGNGWTGRTMANNRQQIEATLNKQVAAKLSTDRLIVAYRAGANGVKDHMLKTARAGINPNGSTMPSYSPRYSRDKARFIRTGKMGKRSLKRTSSAATSVDDKTVLTGDLHRKIIVTNVKAKQDAQGFIAGSFTITTKDKHSSDKLTWLAEKGYRIAPSARGTQAGRQQHKIFLTELQRTLGFKGGAVGLSEA